MCFLQIGELWHKAEFILECKVFSSLCHMRISIFEVMNVYPIDRYPSATPRAMLLHELKKVQLQERFTLMTYGAIGHLKTLCMSVYGYTVAFESEWKCHSSPLNAEKMLPFKYEFSFYVRVARFVVTNLLSKWHFEHVIGVLGQHILHAVNAKCSFLVKLVLTDKYIAINKIDQ